MMPVTVYLQVLLATFLWGTAFPVAKLLLADIGPLTLAGVRFTIAGILLLCVSFFTDRSRPALSVHRPVDWPRVIGIGLLSTFTFYGLFFLGMNLTSASSGAAVDAAGPVVTAIMAHFVLHDDKLTPKRLLAIIIAFSGIALIALTRGQGGLVSPAGCGLILLSLFFSACGTLLVITYRGRFSLLRLTGTQMTLGGILLLVAAILTEGAAQKLHLLGKITPKMLWLSCVSAVAFTLWYGLVRRYKVSSLSVFSFMPGLWGVLLSILVLKEPVSPIFVIGLAAVIGGVVLMQNDKAVHHRAQPDA